jgi:hypothetical protein
MRHKQGAAAVCHDAGSGETTDDKQGINERQCQNEVLVVRHELQSATSLLRHKHHFRRKQGVY